MSTSAKAKERTIGTIVVFDQLSDKDLDYLLEEAGVKPMKQRSLKMHQVLIVWYRGNVPFIPDQSMLSPSPFNDKTIDRLIS